LRYNSQRGDMQSTAFTNTALMILGTTPKAPRHFGSKRDEVGQKLTRATALAPTKYCQTWWSRWWLPVVASVGLRSTIGCKCQHHTSGIRSVFLSITCEKTLLALSFGRMGTQRSSAANFCRTLISNS